MIIMKNLKINKKNCYFVCKNITLLKYNITNYITITNEVRACVDICIQASQPQIQVNNL
jgi:hypothetical protein